MPAVGRELAALGGRGARRRAAPDVGRRRRRDHRHGQARRPRAQLLERRRRALRARGQHAGGRARRARGARDDERALARRDRVPHRRQPPTRGPVGPAHPDARQLRGVLRAVGSHLGVPGAAEGPPRRRPPGARRTLRGAHAPVRVARRPRSRRGARDPGDEGARRDDHRPARARRPRAQARPGRHPRRRVRGAAAAARARPPRPVGAQPDDARRARRPRGGRLRRRPTTRRASTTRTGSCARSSTGCSSTTSSSSTPCPPTRRARTRLARVLGYRGGRVRSELEAFDADQRAHQRTVRTIHERLFFAPLLDALAGVGPLTPEAAEERLAAFGFTDIDRTRAAVRELADGLTRRSKLLQQLLPAGARVAVVDARPRPRAPPAAPPRRGAGALGVARDDASATRRAPRNGRARCSGRRAWSATPSAVTPSSSRSSATTTRSRARRRTRSWCTSRWRRSGGGATRPSGGPGSAASSAASCCASRAATCSASRRSRRPSASSPRSPTPRWKPRSWSLEPPVPFAIVGARPPRRRRAVVRVRRRRAVRLRRRPGRRLRRRRARRHHAARGDRRGHARGPDVPRSTPASAPRGARARSPARSAATPATTTSGASPGSARRW